MQAEVRKILAELNERLFEHEEEQIDRKVAELLYQNNTAKKHQAFGFMHMGKRYVPKSLRNTQRTSRTQVPSVAFTLLKEANNLSTTVSMLELDKQQINAVLFKQLYQCNDLQEVRDSLPDCLVPLVPELRGYARKINDPCYLNRSDERTVRQFHKILPKIEVYAMTKLMY